MYFFCTREIFIVVLLILFLNGFFLLYNYIGVRKNLKIMFYFIVEFDN